VGGTVYVMKQRQARQQQQQAAATQAPVAKGSITVTSDPPGASIWIDGLMREEVTPATIKQLPTGGHPIEVKLSKDGFESFKQTVSLTEGAPASTLDAKLSKGSVVIDVNVMPEAAKATFALDGKKYSTATIDGIASGDEHKLVVSAPGYVDYSTKFIGQPQEKKHFEVTLQKVVLSGGTSHVEIAPRGSGKINVGASGGWCNVSIDGSSKGPTPLAGIELSSGPHRVTCTGPDGRSHSATVVVPVDGTARYKFNL